MAFKLKEKSIIQGTSGHKAALKQQDDRRKFELENLRREQAADKARKKDSAKPKTKTSDDLNDYLKKMEELLSKGISPKEAEQMLAENSKPLKQKKQKKQDDFEPAYPGADYSKEQIDKMTEEEKKQKIDGYEPKKSKGKIVYKDGKKYYQASDGTLHTGQVEDYERELEIDKANKPLKMTSPARQKNKPMVQGGKFIVQPEIKKPERRGIPELPAYLGKLVEEEPKQLEVKPMVVGRYPDAYIPEPEFQKRKPLERISSSTGSKKKKTKVGKFLNKITKRKKKK